ncbi:SapC family protein [Alteromonas gracilis]|uniref:SapC family protein n=1 Tax=Alteromonas gracilis TaxID=1479524 RepID=UPI0037364883
MPKPHFVPLDPIKHKDVRLIHDDAFSHAEAFNFVNVGFNEIATLSGCMPLVIIDTEQGSPLTLACCLGFEGFGNVFCSGQKWLGHAVPLSIQCHPFNYAIDEHKVKVLIDESCKRVTQDTNNSTALFSSDGQPSSLLKQQQENLATLLNGQQQAQAFVDVLKQHDLLSPLSISITLNSGQTLHTHGLYSIDENKFAQLKPETVIQFHKEGISMAINAMLLSLRQYNRLVQLTQTFEDPAMKVGIKLESSQ